MKDIGALKIVKVGFLGFGNIGMGIYKILTQSFQQIEKRENIRFIIHKILVKDLKKSRAVHFDRSVFTSQVADVVDDPEISLIVEVMGGEVPAREYILRALENNKTVVTANKEVVARHWHEFLQVAVEKGVGLYYEASVAGGIPIIKMVNESLQANKIASIMAIINGTTNYIFTKMTEEGLGFEDALDEAKRLGYAEPNPSSDISGLDALYKISILSSLAFHTKVPIDKVFREGIAHISMQDIAYGKEFGFVIKLLAIAKKQGANIEARVHPTFIPKNHPLAAVRDSFNAIFLNGDAVGNLMLYGRGAGELPTGSAVVSDMITAVHHEGQHKIATFFNEKDSSEEVIFSNDWATEFFIHLTVKDKPGVLSKIAGVFGKYQVSIASMIQKDHSGETAPLIFVTHQTREQDMEQAILRIKEIEDVICIENVIRVER